GDSIYLFSYFRNIFTDEQIEVVISRPEKTVFVSWMWNSQWTFYSASWLFFLMFLEDDELGDCNYSITYPGILYEHDFQLLDPQGVNLNSDKNCLEIFPVPSRDFVTINLVINEPFQIVLINSLNMQVYAEQVQNKMGNSIVLDISGFESGIYFVRVNTDTASYLSKIIKL
ncbi:MAG: T9SS type A sorting domain-containing protein, partial [Bacteroidales bacterium]|nr:T9SS type A sorting domain-containing protein [Bacteroidales bacterium]